MDLDKLRDQAANIGMAPETFIRRKIRLKEQSIAQIKDQGLDEAFAEDLLTDIINLENILKQLK